MISPTAKTALNKLLNNQRMSVQELELIVRLQLEGTDKKALNLIAETARKRTLEVFSNKIYIRGLLEFTNYCKQNCYYCGLRRDNKEVHRYRLTKDEILNAAAENYKLGFRTFVLQGGEDPYYTPLRIAEIIKGLKQNHPDCAVTLSVGELSNSDYLLLFKAGADRFLLRHETADEDHYKTLHPPTQTLENRSHCLKTLTKIGYQAGAGFMVGSPNQTPTTLAKDLYFLQNLNPAMVGIGPFIPQHDSPFKDFTPGTVDQTVYLLSIIRLLLPKTLLPATTALATMDPKNGRKRGILAGANVVMPNISPPKNRHNYALYDNKLISHKESSKGLEELQLEFNSIGYEYVIARGDYPSYKIE